MAPSDKQMVQVTFSEEGILSSQPHHLEAIGRTEQHVPRVTATGMAVRASGLGRIRTSAWCMLPRAGRCSLRVAQCFWATEILLLVRSPTYPRGVFEQSIDGLIHLDWECKTLEGWRGIMMMVHCDTSIAGVIVVSTSSVYIAILPEHLLDGQLISHCVRSLIAPNA